MIRWPYDWGLRWWLSLWAWALPGAARRAPAAVQPLAPVIPLHRGPAVRPRGEGGITRRVEP